ncbi:MAG: GDP-mannose 4,6-dehydratase [Chloroflexota bacterium]|nr:GDP-mannose 4,6-dehydratase [Chloroflexota bacterium]
MITLVTGGAGFIGSHLVDTLVHEGGRVVVLDDFSQSTGENLDAYKGDDRVRVVQGSILDDAAVGAAMEGCTHVFHLAAVIGVRYVVDDPLRGILTNTHGTEIVLAHAARLGLRTLVASSSEVYGRGVRAPFKEDDDSLIGPTSIPRWSYALSKGLDEHLALAYHRQQGLPVSIVRYFNTYGPRCLPGGYGVIARFVERALTGQSLIVHGDGAQTRCFTYADDSVQGTFLAGTMESAIGQVFNLGTPRETTVAELAERVRALTGVDAPVEYVPHEREYGPGFEDTRRRVPDTRKAAELLGFEAWTSLDDGLRRTIDWWTQRIKV